MGRTRQRIKELDKMAKMADIGTSGNRAPRPVPAHFEAPMSHNIQKASKPQIHEYLNWIINDFGPGVYKVPCDSEAAALSLRNRMNRVRADDRAEVIAGAEKVGFPLNPLNELTPLDRLIIKLRGRFVEVEVCGGSLEDAKAEFIRANSGADDASEVETPAPEPTLAPQLGQVAMPTKQSRERYTPRKQQNGDYKVWDKELECWAASTSGAQFIGAEAAAIHWAEVCNRRGYCGPTREIKDDLSGLI